MKPNTNRLPLLAALCAMIALILDSQTAMQAAADGVQLCIRTAIPSLFPFFVISAYLVPYISQLQLPLLEKLLHLPAGWGSVFLLSCVGGYPIGAQCIAQGCSSDKLDKRQAARMIGFCNNCGPSFLFGIVGTYFSGPWFTAALMVICIGSAVIVGTYWPFEESAAQALPSPDKIPLVSAVQQATRSMVTVCAWIILGKVLLAFLNKWVLWRFQATFALLISGLLELTNGCLLLNRYPNEQMRFVAACTVTSFGGLCVAMQVRAICMRSGLNSHFYLPQKVCQAMIAAGLSAVYVSLSLNNAFRIMIIVLVIVLIAVFGKLTVEIPKYVMYNNRSKGGL